nr:SPOR domain-containing protein [Candidatus Thiosymbion oneisti]
MAKPTPRAEKTATRIDPSDPKSDRQDGFLAAADDTHEAKIRTRKTKARKKVVARKTPAVAKPAPPAEKTPTRVVKTKRPGAPTTDTPDRVTDTAEPSASEPKVAIFTTEGKPRQRPRSSLYLQVGAFGSRVNAEHLRHLLVNHIAEQVRIRTLDDNETPWYKVQVGPLDSQQSARDLSQHLASLGLKGSHIVVE